MFTHAGDTRQTPLKKVAGKILSMAAITLAGGTRIGVRESEG